MRRDDVKINLEDAGRFVRKNVVSGCLFNLSVVMMGSHEQNSLELSLELH